jgi:hypothetical protein
MPVPSPQVRYEEDIVAKVEIGQHQKIARKLIFRLLFRRSVANKISDGRQSQDPSGGKGPRTFQCFECDRPDPLKTDTATGWLKGELRPPE